MLGAAVPVAVLVAALAVAAPAQATTTAIRQLNLVADQPGHAMITDPNLVNAWGMSHGPGTPLWVSDNGADVSTLYSGAVGGTPVSPVPLVVSIPGGAPTGQVFNDTSSFVIPDFGVPAKFIFAGEDGDISAWAPGWDAVRVAHLDHAVLKGLTLVHSAFGPLLLAADFHNDRVAVLDPNFHRLHVDGLFHDPRIPAGYAPFDVQVLGSRVYVTYAKQDAAKHDDVAGPGHGFLDVYTTYGSLIDRLASRGVLNSPWGLVVAPPTWGSFAGDLLVGNFGDGLIHAFDRATGMFRGTLTGVHGAPIRIDGLWGLIRGDSAAGGANSVWFSAGPDGEAHGLLGLLRPA